MSKYDGQGTFLLRKFENPDIVTKKKLPSMFAKIHMTSLRGHPNFYKSQPLWYTVEVLSFTNTSLTVLKMPGHGWALEYTNIFV